jgi:large subunit ribosomal protein L17
MRHQKSGRKLNRTSSHKKALMRNLATAIITHKRIATTEAKAKELRPYIEKLITRAKKALVREQQNKLPEGQTIDIHARRMVSADVFGKGAVQELFDTIAPKVAERAGGYCRIIKTGMRRGDAARTAIIQLVDWFDVQDGATSTKRKKKTAAKPKTTETAPAVEAKVEKKKKTVAAAPAEEVAAPIAEVAAPVEEVVAEVAAPVEEVVAEVAAPVEEVLAEEAAPVEEVVAEEAAPVEEVVEEAVAEVVAPVEEVVAEEAAPVEEVVAEEAAPAEEVVAEITEEVIPSDDEESVTIKKSED